MQRAFNKPLMQPSGTIKNLANPIPLVAAMPSGRKQAYPEPSLNFNLGAPVAAIHIRLRIAAQHPKDHPNVLPKPSKA